MKIDKYEIDMLAVGQADALLIHFHDSEKDKWYIVLVDAGHKTDAVIIKDFIAEHYDGAKTIDLAICTHLDADHVGGFVSLFDDIVTKKEDALEIKEFWFNNNLGQNWKDDVKDLIKDLKKITQNAKSYGGVSIKYAFSDNKHHYTDVANNAFCGVIKVLGPSEEYFDELFAISESADSKSFSATDDTDESESNKSSIIFLFQPGDGQKYLFTGDATKESFEKLRGEGLYSQIANCTWLKVPHHGSANNLDETLIKHINAQYAYITNDEGNTCFSIPLIKALQKQGTQVCIANSNKWHSRNIPNRADYSYEDVYYPKIN